MLECNLYYTNLGISSPAILLRLCIILLEEKSNVVEVTGTLNVLRTARTKFTSTDWGICVFECP